MDPSTGVNFTHYIYISILNSQKHFNIQSILKLITFNVSDNGSINKRVIHYNMSEFGTLLWGNVGNVPTCRLNIPEINLMGSII